VSGRDTCWPFFGGRDFERENREKEKKREKGKVTSHLLVCYPMEADVHDDHLAFGPTLEYGRIFEYGLQRALG
jgi:hypothetical protein